MNGYRITWYSFASKNAQWTVNGTVLPLEEAENRIYHLVTKQFAGKAVSLTVKEIVQVPKEKGNALAVSSS